MILASHGIISSGAGVTFDTDAQAFITAASISDLTQQTAINSLVTDLKTYNIWTKMKAIYPFVGGTASTHKWNLKDPRDLDAAFRLQFNGGWTHSSTGALPNGTTGYADTKLIPSIILSSSSAHFSKYNRTNDLTGNKADGTVHSTYSSFFQHNYTSANMYIGVLSSGVTYTPVDTRGFFLGVRASSTITKNFRNNVQLGSTNTNLSNELPNQTVGIGVRNDVVPFGYNNYESAFASIGDGLTDTEVENFYTAVQAYQTSLSRQV
jgi:hypothetical protein